MVDSRAKGMRGEYIVRDILREYTGLQFERVPSSGALEYLKGDLYIPGHVKNKYCIEVKNYKESPLSDKMFTREKTCNLTNWWLKLKRQAEGGGQKPLLFFKYNRSKVFVVTEKKPEVVERYFYISWLDCYVMLADIWLHYEQPIFLEK